VLVELGEVGSEVPWLPGARRWDARRSPTAAVADLGVYPLVELADRLCGATEWAIVVGPGGEFAARKLFELAGIWWEAGIVPRALEFEAHLCCERVRVAMNHRERWCQACDLLLELGAGN
jgi:hypothetical protein